MGIGRSHCHFHAEPYAEPQPRAQSHSQPPTRGHSQHRLDTHPFSQGYFISNLNLKMLKHDIMFN